MLFQKLGKFVVRYPIAILCFWTVLALAAAVLPPHWNDVTLDGDLAFLPAGLPSVEAERLFREAFPQRQAKSQLVFAISRKDEPLTEDDLRFADKMASPLQNVQGVMLYQAAIAAEASQSKPPEDELPTPVQQVMAAWEESALLDSKNWQPLWNMAFASQQYGDDDAGKQYREQAIALRPELKQETLELVPVDPINWNQFDVLTRHTLVRGDMLTSKNGHAVLIVVESRNEFMATDNIRVLQEATQYVETWRTRAQEAGLTHLDIGVTGNAAIGGEMLMAAKESIANTELYTILLVIIILLLIYRTPMLLTVPLLSIAVSFIISSWLVALLTQVHLLPGMDWFDFKVFKTSRIFIVVILFGAGTDFCLFLIGRYREELARCRDHDWAIARALAGVGEALTASAMTTVVGLGMMFFADFEKYRNSGPAIGLCLLITLLTCLTLAPAIMRFMGQTMFWPWGDTRQFVEKSRPVSAGWWERISQLVCSRPGLTLTVVVLLLGIVGFPSLYKRITTGRAVEVSYDLFGDLDDDRMAKQTALRIRNYFPLGESGPLTILAVNPAGQFMETQGQAITNQLAVTIFNTDDDVERVFTSEQPLGDRPVFTFSSRGRQILMLKNHSRTKEFFLAQEPKWSGQIALFRVLTDRNPFSNEAIALMDHIETNLQEEIATLPPPWNETKIYIQGTTPSIRDLMKVTTQDQKRIELGVIVAVFLVLLVILRRPMVCAYMILSVLFSYYVTLGITELFFRTVYADSYQALDWKVPLFLFVILAAIGQDYNVYLATRVFEEQRRLGLRDGLLRGMTTTGGIITSCGLVMAGTFASMCMGTLLGVIEIGFALTVGVLLDTFVVRTIMLPCFLALMNRFSDDEVLTQAGKPPE
ncbi:Putative membrane protein YdgH [Bremerella volcania]|uniref:Membrane protein YdgH n=1 Tax=Bremerella volcania TaxID=2527984 RepID=A0A518CDV6_9BACT|nr:MMPL family transporter [Bremerella volcania]QDU77399.1 Putative membrane protein YdgH [Bremerella volcania]